MNPSLTPLTMLLMSARERPCNARAWASSPWRVTITLPASILATVRAGKSRFSLPLGPSTEIFWPWIWTLTLAGMTTGCLPMRDMVLRIKNQNVSAGSPDVAKQLAADVVFPGLLAAHDALRCRDNRRSEPAADTRDFIRADIIAEAR